MQTYSNRQNISIILLHDLSIKYSVTVSSYVVLLCFLTTAINGIPRRRKWKNRKTISHRVKEYKLSHRSKRSQKVHISIQHFQMNCVTISFSRKRGDEIISLDTQIWARERKYFLLCLFFIICERILNTRPLHVQILHLRGITWRDLKSIWIFKVPFDATFSVLVMLLTNLSWWRDERRRKYFSLLILCFL